MQRAWGSAAWWRAAGAPDLRHIAVEKWSRGNSGLHRRDARAKLFVLGVFLVTDATASRGLPVLAGLLFAVLWAALVWARLPVTAVLLRAGVVFSFTLPFALISVMTGDSG